MTWRARELWTEARADLGPRTLAIGWIACVALAGAGLATASLALSATHQEDNLRRDGSLVVDVQYQESSDLTHQRTISGRACESLNTAEGVEAAGGRLLGTAPAPVTFRGGPVLPAVYVTPHALRVWQPDAALDGIVIGTDLEGLGAATVGSHLLWADGRTSVIEARAPTSLPPSVLRSSVMVPHLADAPLAECWIRMSPGNLSAGLDLASAVFAQSSVDVVPWLAEQTQTMNPSQQWHAIADWHPWLAVAALLAFIAFIVTWTRRAETGIYRAFGTTNIELTVLVSAEVAIVGLPAALWATVITITGTALIEQGPLSTDLVRLIVQVIASTTLLTLALSPAAARLALRGTILDQLKDR